MKNKLVIAAAGAGKTSFLIDEAIKRNENVLITTYTRSNAEEIRKKIYNREGYIPSNIEIQTWFEFLLRQGVRPFQGTMHDYLFERKIGFFLVNQKSTKGISQTNILKYYFNKKLQIFSDKISDFIIKCDDKLNGDIISRISKIYSHIFIDEIQDLVGYDLDILKKLILSKTELLMVGDPRQTTYATHPTDKYKKYQNGKIIEFIKNEINKKICICEIDDMTLNQSHRNNEKICFFSSQLFPGLPKSIACKCESCRNYDLEHIGVFLLQKEKLAEYLKKYNPVQLRWDIRKKCNTNYPVFNFGDSKGLSFDRVIIYPTKDMKTWIDNNSTELADETKAKFYVALTRARKSVAIVID
jgi:DNA helicase-2/ATP-dependent DNA helicase PcrA